MVTARPVEPCVEWAMRGLCSRRAYCPFPHPPELGRTVVKVPRLQPAMAAELERYRREVRRPATTTTTTTEATSMMSGASDGESTTGTTKPPVLPPDAPVSLRPPPPGAVLDTTLQWG